MALLAGLHGTLRGSSRSALTGPNILQKRGLALRQASHPVPRHQLARRSLNAELPERAWEDIRSVRPYQGRQPAAHVLTCCTEYRQETAILQRSATRNGFAFHAVGLGKPWGGFSTKFLTYYAALHQLLASEEVRPDALVIVMDAWDTVILGDADELLHKTRELSPDAVLGNAETVCGPNHFLTGRIEQLYPDGSTTWRYPNSGGLLGSGQAMLALLEGLIYETSDGNPIDASENDQVRLHDFLLMRAEQNRPFPLRLDTQCQVFQCMFEETPQWEFVQGISSRRMLNKHTQTQPLIAHGNGDTGRWFLSALYHELQLLDKLGLTTQELAHLPHEMPVPPGTPVAEADKMSYEPWHFDPKFHSKVTDGFATFRMIRDLQRQGKM